MTLTHTGTTPTGVHFARFVRALAIGRGDPIAAEAYAQGQPWHTPAVLCALKALSTPMSVSDYSASTRAIQTDFAEYLRVRSVVGRLQGLRRVPFKVRMLAASAGTSAAWVGGNHPIPVARMTLGDNGEQLLPLKVGGISIVTMELIRNSDTIADALVARDVSAGIVEKMDESFVDPANGGVADVSPASITYGAQSFESRGSTTDAIDADLADMLRELTDGNLSLETAAWVMAPQTAASLALKRGTDGALAYPGMNARGGVLCGLPVLTSNACTASGSPGERFIVLVEASEILLADDGESELDVSGEAAVQMDDAPAEGAQQMVSLWQNGLAGVRGLRFLNWKRRRDYAVAVLRSVNY